MNKESSEPRTMMGGTAFDPISEEWGFDAEWSGISIKGNLRRSGRANMDQTKLDGFRIVLNVKKKSGAA